MSYRKKKIKKRGKKNVAEMGIKMETEWRGQFCSAEELQHIIAKAIIEAEDLKQKRERKEKEESQREWEKSIGIMEYENTKPWIFAKILEFLNTLKVIFCALFLIKKNKIKEDRVIFNFLRLLLSGICLIVQYAFIIWSLGVVIYLAKDLFGDRIIVEGSHLFLFLISILSLAFASIFRIMRFEIEKIEDKNIIVGLFSSFTAIISIIIAVITIAIA